MKRSWFSKACKPFCQVSSKTVSPRDKVEIRDLDQTLRFAILALAATGLTAACAAPPGSEREPADTGRDGAAGRSAAVSDPAAPINERFASLDEYLAYRESRAAVDDAWYREIRPGVYVLESGNYHGPTDEQRTFTRAELMRKYGFTR